MKVAVVTTFSPKGYEVYGRKMIESFAEYWPTNVRLLVYYEGERPKDAHDRAEWIPLDAYGERQKFIAANSHRPDDPLDYRFRVIRYCHKVFAQVLAWHLIERDTHLLWLDADTVTVNLINREVMTKLLPPEGKIASYLGRPYHTHTETGFIAYGLEAGEFLAEMERVYLSGEVFKLPQWHDCMVFDHARRQYERQGKRFHNLCPNAIGLGVFEQSPLAPVIRHNKGAERKEHAYGDDCLVA